MENNRHSSVNCAKKTSRSSTRYKNFSATTNLNDLHDDNYLSHEKKYKTKFQNSVSYPSDYNSYRNRRNYKTRYPNQYSNNYKKYPSHNKIIASQQQIQSKIDFSKVPSLALTKIFSFMNLGDCLNASITCKSWRSNLMLNSPSLWHKFPLTIYLCNKHDDLESHKFKLSNFSNLCSSLTFKFDANDFYLIKKLNDSLAMSQFLNLKQLRLDPVFNLYIEDDTDSMNADYYDDNIANIGKLVLSSLIKIMNNSKAIEHLSIGLLNYKNPNDVMSMKELLSSASKYHSNNLKSLHVSTCPKATSVYLSHRSYNQKMSLKSIQFFDAFIPQFIHLESLSLDFKDLSISMIQSDLFKTSLKK